MKSWEELVVEVLGDDNWLYVGGGIVGNVFWCIICGNIEYIYVGIFFVGDDVLLVYVKWWSVDFYYRRMILIIGDYL